MNSMSYEWLLLFSILMIYDYIPSVIILVINIPAFLFLITIYRWRKLSSLLFWLVHYVLLSTTVIV
jgi:hypothetical protein